MQDTQDSPSEQKQGRQVWRVNVPGETKNAEHSENPGTEGYCSP